MANIERYTLIGKEHILSDPNSYNIFIYGVETKIGKALFDQFTSDGLHVVAPLRGELPIEDASVLEDFHAYYATNNNNFSCVINCESFYSSGEYTPDQFIQRHKNLIDFAAVNGSTYVCLSTYQVFDGTTIANEIDPRSPLTLQGTIYSQIEDYLEEVYATQHDNFVSYRLPWLFSYSGESSDNYEFDIDTALTDFLVGRDVIYVSDNMYGSPYNIETLMKELPYAILAPYRGFLNIGSLNATPISLHSLVTSLLDAKGASGVSVLTTETTAISGASVDNEFVVLGPYNNKALHYDMNAYNLDASLNMIKLKTNIECYRDKSTSFLDTLPVLKPFWQQFAQDSYGEEIYADYNYFDLPQSVIDEMVQWVAGIEAGTIEMNSDTNAEDLVKDLAMVKYIFLD